MYTPAYFLLLILGLWQFDLIHSHASVCEPTARKDPSVFKECVDEILFLGDFFSPFIMPNDKLQAYIEPKFSSPVIAIEDTMCCTKPLFQPMSKSINCLAFEPHPAVLYYEAPEFEWQFVPNASIGANDFYTLVMISISSWRTDHNLGYPERPPVYWLVADIQGFDWKKGKQVLHYNSPVTTDTYLILYYKQHHNPIAEVPLGPYASFGEGCPTNFKNACIFQLEKYLKDQMLTLVATTWFMVTADQFSSVYSINHLGKSPAEGCLLGFPHLKPMEDGFNVNCNHARSLTASLFGTLVIALVCKF